MKTNTIITIGRQYGSAGRQIGRVLAEELGIKCTIKSYWNVQQRKVDFAKNFLRIMMKNQLIVFCILWLWIHTLLVILHRHSLICQLIRKFSWLSLKRSKKIAAEGPCIMIGRCADYALADFDNCFSVFFHADLQTRIRRIAKIYDLTRMQKQKIVSSKTDKNVPANYNYYTKQRWGDARFL